MKKQIASTLALSIALAGCATASKDIAANYVSPMQYQSYSCEQLVNEMRRVESRVNQLSGRLDEAAANDKAIAGVGAILFWPALFALGGTKQQEAEYSRLKGEYDAVEQSLNAKKCYGVIASNTTSSMQAPSASGQQSRSKEEKLKELKQLHEAGLIASEVYASQQKSILAAP